MIPTASSLLNIDVTDTRVVVVLIDSSKKVIVDLKGRDRLSERLHRDFLKIYNSASRSKTLNRIVISYIPGTVRYSRLRTIFTIANTFGVLKGIPLSTSSAALETYEDLKRSRGEKIIHPQYTTS